MKPAFTSRIILLLCAFTFLFQPINAQPPSLAHSAGFPQYANGTGVAYGNSVYVSVFYGGTIYISPDGITWAKVSDPGIVAGTFSRIAFGAGVFVVVGANGLVLTSANGLNWTSRSAGTSNSFLDVQYLQSAFYATGRNATLRRSADGINWSTITIAVGSATDDFNCITYGNSAFAIGARPTVGGGISVYRSTTANSGSWNYQNFSPTSSLNRLIYLKNKFFIFCSGTEIFTSADASTWTNSSSSLILTQPDNSTATLSSPNQMFNGIYDGTKIYLFGYSGGYYSSYGSIFSSTDGINFTLQSKTAFIVCQGSAYLNGRYFEYGNEGIISSPNGIDYKYSNGSYYAMASSGTSYVGVGFAGNQGVIFTSTDYSSWTDKTPSSTQNPLFAAVYDGSKYVAAGDRTVVQSTDNGNTWTEIATPTDYIVAMAFGAGKYAEGGYDANTYVPRLAYSSDGISWTTANTANNYYFKVKYVNGKFFALGYDNDTYLARIMYSDDAVSWSDVTPTLGYSPYYFNDVIYDGSKYHFMGMEASGFFSVSTATPTNTASFANKATIDAPNSALGGNFGEGAFAYSNGRYAGAVTDVNTGAAYIIYSSNGTSWTAIDAGELSSVYGIVAEGDKFRMLGTSAGVFTLTFNAALPVKLTFFNASSETGQSLLQWKTASEINSSHFTVQHSMDAINWQSIGTVKAAGQSSITRAYQFTHTSPGKGSNYYRLLQVDADGKTVASAVKQVYFGKAGNAQLYPNPARASVQVLLPGTGAATVTLFNASGQPVYQQSGSGDKMQLSIGNLSKGIYQVQISQGAVKYTLPLSHQ
ncbi:MAG: T9SS type A sorting domain-containing protein [Chitinophagaceae bacterium]